MRTKGGAGPFSIKTAVSCSVLSNAASFYSERAILELHPSPLQKKIVVLQSPADNLQTKDSETVITVIFPQLISKYLSKMSSISTLLFGLRHKIE